ncbi:MAG: hypothetical protein HY814_06915 [Candidatus Riflebacteria bacterium]|nr:hypothetical protein [Candidatus Riflebacteria bacterium]
MKRNPRFGFRPRRAAGFVLALSLGLMTLMLLMGFAMTQVAPKTSPAQIDLARGSLPLEGGRLMDVTQAGLNDAEHELRKTPSWTVGFTDKAFSGEPGCSGRYTVSVTSGQIIVSQNSVLNHTEMVSTGVDEAGRMRIVRRRIGMGSDSMKYTIYSGGTLSLAGLTASSPVRGGLYGRAGVVTGGSDAGYFVVSPATGGPDISAPTIDWQGYYRVYGFDPPQSDPGNNTGFELNGPNLRLWGDHRDSRIIYSAGHCTLDQADVVQGNKNTPNPFQLSSVFVRNHVVIQGPATATPKRTSTITADYIDDVRDFPALVVYGNLKTDHANVDNPTAPVEITGLVFVDGSVELKDFTLHGALYASGSVTLIGNCLIEPGNLPLVDPMTYPPFLTPGVSGLFLARISQNVLR